MRDEDCGGGDVLEGDDAPVGAWVFAGVRGHRTEMEDAVVAERVTDDICCFAVFDGHGGDFVSRWAAEALPQALRAAIAARPKPFLKAALPKLDELLLGMDRELANTALEEVLRCGSTAAILLATASRLVVANLGDSRAVLCRGTSAVPLSKDHKPTDPEERRRITASGGGVFQGRVNGALAVSRALGDFYHKQATKDGRMLPQAAQPVSPQAEMHEEARTEEDRFVLLACDGVWDVMSSAEAVGFCLERLEAEREARRGPDAKVAKSAVLQAVSVALIKECLYRGSTDNISAVLVMLDDALLNRSPSPPAQRKPQLLMRL